MINASWSRVRARVTLIVSVTSQSACCIALVTSSRDDLGVVGEVAEVVEAECGPDVEPCDPHRFGAARQHECDELRIDLYRRTGHACFLPHLPAYVQPVPVGRMTGRQYGAYGKERVRMASLPA